MSVLGSCTAELEFTTIAGYGPEATWACDLLAGFAATDLMAAVSPDLPT